MDPSFPESRLDLEESPSPLARKGRIVLSSEAAERFSSEHSEVFSAETATWPLGSSKLTREVPNAKAGDTDHLDEDGKVEVGTAVWPHMILVGMASPKIPGSGRSFEERALARISGRQDAAWEDVSLRVPTGVSGVVTRVEEIDVKKNKRVEVEVSWERKLEVGDTLVDEEEQELMVTGIRTDLVRDGLWGRATGSVTVRKVSSARDRMHARSIGPYSIVTEQPLGGKTNFGAQRVDRGDLEVAHAFGAEKLCLEWTTVKSDNPRQRARIYEGIVTGRPELTPEIPKSARVLATELMALALHLDLEDEELTLVPVDSEEIRELSRGEVKKPETLNYRTFLPEKGGLFCEEIFGAVQTESRAEQFGHVELAVPAVHPWFAPSVALLLGIESKALYRVLDHKARLIETTSGGYSAETEPGDHAWEETGGVAVARALGDLDLEQIAGEDGPARAALARRMLEGHVKPKTFVFDAIPVLPPDLRPLVPLSGGRFATSDLNDLYRRVINRSNRLKRLLELNAPEIILHNEGRQLQEAVDALMQNGVRGRKVTGPNRRELRSLTDMAAGRLGWLLKKRVDYSGVAALVPEEGLDDRSCRVPQELLLEIFKPFLYEALEQDGHAGTIREAKTLVEGVDPTATLALEEVIRDHPVVLASFREKRPDVPPRLVACNAEPLVGEAAIRASPAVCDHLGPLVAFHLPLSSDAVDEARYALRWGARGTGPSVEAGSTEGWLAQAMGMTAQSDILDLLVGVALFGTVDPVTDPMSRLALGRTP